MLPDSFTSASNRWIELRNNTRHLHDCFAMASRTRNTTLQTSLRKAPLSPEFECAAANKIWDLNLKQLEYLKARKYYRGYFSHIYQDLSKAACTGDDKLGDYTHLQILDVADLIKSSNESREVVARTLSGDREQIDRAMSLAAGLLVPFNFKGIGGARRGESVTWLQSETLKSLVTRKSASLMSSMNHGHSTCSRCLSSDSSIRFPKSFTARQLEHVAGIKIIWTSNLLDHLLILDDDERVKVHIFHQVTLLENNQKLPKFVSAT